MNMQINPYNGSTPTQPTTHTHHVTEHLFNSPDPKPKEGGMSAKSGEDLGVIYTPSETTQVPEEASVNLLQQALDTGKDMLKKFWGPSKAELEAMQTEDSKLAAEKISPYPGSVDKKENVPSLFTRAKVKIIDFATNLFHFMSGKSFSTKQEQKREKPKQVVIENVKLDLHTDMPNTGHLLDSYDRTGAYAPLSTQNLNTNSPNNNKALSD